MRNNSQPRFQLLKSLPLITILALFLPLSGCARDGIDRDDVGRIISYLAADSMKGRASFTPENTAAAAFIAEEFRKAGLRPTGGNEDFEQKFTIRRLQPQLRSVVINGDTIGESNLIIYSSLREFDWTEKDSISVIPMGEDFDRSLFRSTNRGIILVPTRHADRFRRYRRFFNGPVIDPDEGRARTLAAILTDVSHPASFKVSYRATEDQPVLRNVIGVLPGKRSGECVIFSGHYDHVGILAPVEGDSIANGASDDASGTTGVIALARYFASLGQPERTLMFVAFGGEEIGIRGSRYLASVIDPDTIAAMINMEMISSVSRFGPKTFWITGYDRSSLGPAVSDALKETEFGAFPDPYPDQNLFFRSDNASFARLGVPAHSFSTYQMDTDSVYHTVHDDLRHVDIDALTNSIRGIAAGVKGLVDGSWTPTRLPLTK